VGKVNLGLLLQGLVLKHGVYDEAFEGQKEVKKKSSCSSKEESCDQLDAQKA